MTPTKSTVLRVLGSILLLYVTLFVWPMWHDFLHENGHAVAFIEHCEGGAAVVTLGAYFMHFEGNPPAGEIAYQVDPGYFYHSLYRTSGCGQVPPTILQQLPYMIKEFGNDTSKYPAEFNEASEACYGGKLAGSWFKFAGPFFGFVFTYATFTAIMVVVMAYSGSWGEIQPTRSPLNHGWRASKIVAALKKAPLVMFMPERVFLDHLSTSIPRSTRILYAFCIRIVQADQLNEIFYGWLPGRTIIFTWSLGMDGPSWWSVLTGASDQTMLIVSYVLWVILLGLYLYGFWLMYKFTRHTMTKEKGHSRLLSKGDFPSQLELGQLK